MYLAEGSLAKPRGHLSFTLKSAALCAPELMSLDMASPFTLRVRGRRQHNGPLWGGGEDQALGDRELIPSARGKHLLFRALILPL